MTAHRRAQSLGDVARFVGGGVDQHEELVTAGMRSEIVLAQTAPHQLVDGAKCVGGVSLAVRVHESLEVIDVRDEERDGPARLRLGDRGVCGLDKSVVREESVLNVR